MLKIEIRTVSSTYPVYLNKGFLGVIGTVLRRHHAPCPVLLITDKNVSIYYEEICRQSLLNEGFKPYTVTLEGGEENKNLHSALKIYEFALKSRINRNSLVLALGGGVIGDLSGFVAATYLRGIPYAQVPTTLLAMVDSSVGGKVAVNHPLGKNIIGSFYQPCMVFADIDTLKTLPHREFVAGLAELIKYGIVLDADLFNQLENFIIDSDSDRSKWDMFNFKASKIIRLVAKAVLIKSKVVSLDEKEEGFRQILNFGHTIGHALETATDYNYFIHGEAVTVGMLAATRLSANLEILGERDAERITNLLITLNHPSPPKKLTLEAVMKGLQADKKKDGDQLLFVLPSRIGKAVFCKSPPLPSVREVINGYLKHQNIK